MQRRAKARGEMAQDWISSPDGRRVLIVDDERGVRESLAMLLASTGIRVDTAASGSQGVLAVQKRTYDLIVTDLGMPGMDGKEVVARVKSIAPDTPIAVLSGWSDAAISHHFDNQIAQPDFILEKPLVSPVPICQCLRPARRVASRPSHHKSSS